ncbi:MAG: menaquinone biosynthesis protein [Deferribacteres bacterium]|nr:menaquinone biosynthesis protein [Deferribacteres bacterium]
MSRLRLGLISYLNTLPVYYAIEEGLIELDPWVDVVKAVPSRLNLMLSSGELDVSVVSSYEYALHYKDYLILPSLSIGAYGPVKSVLFMSKAPLEELDGRQVFLTRASLTSKNLMLYIFKKLGVRPEFVEFSMDEPIPGDGYFGILLIGDDALRFRKSNSFPYVYDLAELWKTFFGLPFVFALWCVRRESFEAQEDRVRDLWRKLLMSKEVGKRSFREIAEKKASELGLSCEECMDYLKALHFDLEDRYVKGLGRFFREMHDAGFLNELPELNFIPD